ncbi:MAG: ABC transporter substrate-binding protein, partial [Acidimicrobiales bacterium]|nr:ABC transporter substrate-binding protein [Acidimicrobiales bacterium]
FSQPNYLPDIKAAAQAGDLQYVIASGEDDETFILLNMDSPPLDDLRIRQALVYATDVDQYLSLTKTDPGQVADSFLTKQSRWYSDPGWPQHDPAKAKQLVDEYKADHGGQAPKIVLTTSTAPEVREIGQALEQNWEAVGIDVSLNSLEQTQFIATALGGNYQANLWRQYSSPDPDAEYHWWISANAAPIGTIALNFPRLRDEQVDEALNTGRTNPDPEVRKQAYARLQKRFAEIVPVVWLAHTRWVIAADNKVRDILNGPLPDGKPSLPILAGVTRLSQTWLDR